jgi:hypothetical protein
MTDATLVFIEACPDCGRVERVSSKRRPPGKAARLCVDCANARRDRATSPARAESGTDRRG